MDVIREIGNSYVENVFLAWNFLWDNRLFFIVIYSIIFIPAVYYWLKDWLKDRKSQNKDIE